MMDFHVKDPTDHGQGPTDHGPGKDTGMDIITLLFLAAGLSMDAFAVSICKGLAMRKLSIKKCSIVGLWFGSFQGLMPLAGYVMGIQFASYIDTFSSWIAFFLLSFLGANMVREAWLTKDEKDSEDADLGIREMFLLSIATSIDALAVGITFACIPVQISTALSPFLNTLTGCLLIALTTFSFSAVGVGIGNVFGARYKKWAETVGGIILILLGIKMLL